jgi:TRAP-type mannitol/chloroaromatic compound transport system substrate-binding protein
VAFDAIAYGPESSGWFREPIANLGQLRGLKMRFYGLGAEVLARIGTSTEFLDGDHKRGIPSMPLTDLEHGSHRVAKNDYYPGWHRRLTVAELLINAEVWKGLPDSYRAMIETAARAQLVLTLAEGEARNLAPLRELAERHGVEHRRWSDEQLAAFEQAWLQIVEEHSRRDPDFKRFADSYFEFRRRYGRWDELQSLERSYLD